MRYKNILVNLFSYIGLYEPANNVVSKLRARVDKYCFLDALDYGHRKIFVETTDPVRYGAIYLALKRIINDNIKGSFAEAGVWKGYTSKIIHTIEPSRMLYLFDTFEGFYVKDTEEKEIDNRFRDTNIEMVEKNIGNLDNITIIKGYFPDSAVGLDNVSFSFVMLDLDLYAPTLAGLQFFYEKLSSGGYMFIHDYNSPESNWAVSRATNEFLRNKPEKLIEIPDMGGSVIMRKN